MSASAADGREQAGEITPGMQTRLVRESRAGCPDERGVVDELRVEAEGLGQVGLRAELIDDRRLGLSGGRVQIPVDPGEVAIDGRFAHDGIDEVHGGQSGIPRSLGVVRASLVRQVVQPPVGHHRHMRGRVTGVAAAAAAAFEHCHAPARRGQQPGGGQAGDAAANDGDIDVEIAVDRREYRRFRGAAPERRGVARRRDV